MIINEHKNWGLYDVTIEHGNQPKHAIADENLKTERAKSTNYQALKGLYEFVLPYRVGVALAILVLVVTATLSLILPLAVRRVVDGFSDNTADLMNQYFLAAVGIAGLIAIGTALRFYLVTQLGERIVADIRMTVFNRVIGMSPEFFEKIMTGEVLSRLTADTTLILSVVSSSVSLALRNILIFFGGLFFMFFTSPKLTGLALLIVPIVIFPVLLMGKKLRSLSRTSQDKIANTSGLASELLIASQTVQANNHENVSRNSFGEMTEESFKVAKNRILVRAVLTAMLIFFVFTGIVGVLWFGAWNVRSGSLSEGELVQFLIYSVLVAGSVAALSDTFGEIQRAAGASERLIELLNQKDKIKDPIIPISLETPVKGSLYLRNVSFSYPARPKSQILNNFSLQIKAGQTIALVGPSGAGKTTIFQLLMRFYEPEKGSILIDNVKINTLLKSDLRKSFALVPQEPVIFAMNAMENIRFSRPNAVDQEVREAAKAADAHDFISKLPDGYQTYLGERGITLSGGQRQRIAIARAILRDSPILLLDEATSALDSVSERSVQMAVEKLSESRTTIIIAHRLSTVKKADRIVVMESGIIKAIGTHKELVAQGGLYSQFANMQFT